MPSSELPTEQRSLADLVREDSRRAAIFERFALDFCCHGFHTLEESAAERDVPVRDVLDAMQALNGQCQLPMANYQWTELDALTEHIVRRHHEYVRTAAPTVRNWLDKLVSAHGDRHPELFEVRDTFTALHADLLAHMTKEENLLFPFIDELATASRRQAPPPAGPFGTLQHPIRVMEDDHREAGALVERLRRLTSNYTAPPDGCATYHACYDELSRFVRDLHEHIHLENNVLFPAAVELETALSSA